MNSAGAYLYAAAFYVSAAVAIASAFMVVWHRRPVINALSLVVCLLAVAVDYMLLSAHFLALIQVLVYAGAVLVLVMIIMRLDPRQPSPAMPTVGKAVGVAAGFAVTMMVVVLFQGLSSNLNRSGQASPKELTQLLLYLGEDPRAVTRKPETKDPRFDSRSIAKIAAAALLTLTEPGMRDQIRAFEMKDPVTHQSVKKFPSALNTMTDEKFMKFLDDVIGPLAGAADLDKFPIPPQYPEVKPEDFKQLIRAAALSRLALMTNFGNTTEVGRLVLARYGLPFEAAGVLLLVAILGVIVLARRAPGGKQP
jgi:NADH:ubiquinone oxidoreductase subunit 6 (subunit J)